MSTKSRIRSIKEAKVPAELAQKAAKEAEKRLDKIENKVSYGVVNQGSC